VQSHNDRPLIADFGQAMPIGPTGVSDSPTKLYHFGMPPELYLTGKGNHGSDVYQAGLTLYRAANGDPFYRSQTTAAASSGSVTSMILDGTLPNRDSYLPHVPRLVRKVIRKALQTDPTERFTTAREFYTALGRINPNKNWSTICKSNEEIDWSCRVNNGYTLIVSLESQAGRWRVHIRKEKGPCSKPEKKLLWGDKFTRRQAMEHLKGVFDALE
jgi:serine/threonine protein kinase